MAQVITGLDNIPLSAISAAYAPTNTADVTAMIDSAVSGKLDASASSSFQPSGNYVSSSDLSAYLPTSSIGVDSASAVTSIAGSSIATGTQVVTSIYTGGYGVSAINGTVINASHMKLGAAAADNTSNIVKLGDSSYGAGVFLTGNFGTAYYKVNELQLNRNGTGFIGFNIGGAGSQITATSNAGGKFTAGGPNGARSYFTAYNASASASIEVTADSAKINLADSGYTSTIYPSSIPYWNNKLDSSSIETSVDGITGIGGTAIAGGGGTTYTAGQYIQISGDEISVTGLQPSGSYVSSTDLSAYQQTAGMSAYLPTSAIQSGSAGITSIGGTALGGYTAGDGIAIQNNEISVNYDSNTLDTVSGTVTITAAADMQYDPFMHIYDADFVSLLNGQTSANITVHIPEGYFSTSMYFGMPDYKVYLALCTSDPRDGGTPAVYTYAPLSYQYDSLNDEYTIDEQDVVISLPASGVDWYPGTSLSFTDPYIAIVIAMDPSMGTSNPVDYIAGDSYTCTITYPSASSQALTVKNPLPASTYADSNKVLTVNASGSPVWAVGGGGGGADWSAESGQPGYIENKPDLVDIVAGPGIVVDNPDGNTLRISTDSAYETVLYQNDDPSMILTDTNLTLSESYLNFEKIKIESHASGGSTANDVYYVEGPVFQSAITELSNLPICTTSGLMFDLNAFVFQTSATTTCTVKSSGTRLNVASTGISTTANRGVRVRKIIGVHRIANN